MATLSGRSQLLQNWRKIIRKFKTVSMTSGLQQSESHPFQSEPEGCELAGGLDFLITQGVWNGGENKIMNRTRYPVHGREANRYQFEENYPRCTVSDA